MDGCHRRLRCRPGSIVQAPLCNRDTLRGGLSCGLFAVVEGCLRAGKSDRCGRSGALRRQRDRVLSGIFYCHWTIGSRRLHSCRPLLAGDAGKAGVADLGSQHRHDNGPKPPWEDRCGQPSVARDIAGLCGCIPVAAQGLALSCLSDDRDSTACLGLYDRIERAVHRTHLADGRDCAFRASVCQIDVVV